jgi:hypothetical protein
MPLGGLNDTINAHNLIKICIETQAILRFCLTNLRGCKVGITYGRDL